MQGGPPGLFCNAANIVRSGFAYGKPKSNKQDAYDIIKVDKLFNAALAAYRQNGLIFLTADFSNRILYNNSTEDAVFKVLGVE